MPFFTYFPLRRFVIAGLTIFAALAPCRSVWAGTLTEGSWKPSSCGTEPVAPTLHSESSAAYKESVQWVQLYQTQVNAYINCIVKEANADSTSISDVVKAAEHRANDAFHQFKEASDQMGHHQSDDDGPSTHSRHGGQGITFGTSGGD